MNNKADNEIDVVTICRHCDSKCYLQVDKKHLNDLKKQVIEKGLNCCDFVILNPNPNVVVLIDKDKTCTKIKEMILKDLFSTEGELYGR